VPSLARASWFPLAFLRAVKWSAERTSAWTAALAAHRRGSRGLTDCQGGCWPRLRSPVSRLAINPALRSQATPVHPLIGCARRTGPTDVRDCTPSAASQLREDAHV